MKKHAGKYLVVIPILQYFNDCYRLAITNQDKSVVNFILTSAESDYSDTP